MRSLLWLLYNKNWVSKSWSIWQRLPHVISIILCPFPISESLSISASLCSGDAYLYNVCYPNSSALWPPIRLGDRKTPAVDSLHLLPSCLIRFWLWLHFSATAPGEGFSTAQLLLPGSSFGHGLRVRSGRHILHESWRSSLALPTPL